MGNITLYPRKYKACIHLVKVIDGVNEYLYSARWPDDLDLKFKEFYDPKV